MQQESLFSDSTSTSQKRLLRDTLQEHTLTTIDVEQAWHVVAERLSSSSSPVVEKQSRGSTMLKLRAQSPLRWRKIPLLIAIAIFSVVLMGAGIVGSLYFWGGPFGDAGIRQIGDQHLYTTIQQQQHIGPTLISVTKAYADTGRTLIAYDVQIAPHTQEHYSGVTILVFSLHDQSGEETVGHGIECTGFPQNGNPMHCLLTLGAFHAGADVSHLNLTWRITQISLAPLSNPSQRKILTGSWSFTFTVPFFSVNRGSGGPVAQPTPKP